MRDHAAQHLSPSVLQPVDLVLDRARRNFGRNVQLEQPFVYFRENAGVRGHRENGADAVYGQKLDRAVILSAGERVGLEDFRQIFGDVAGAPVLHFKGTHALARESVAVEHGHQFQSAAHVAAVIQDDEQVGGVVI